MEVIRSELEAVAEALSEAFAHLVKLDEVDALRYQHASADYSPLTLTVEDALKTTLAWLKKVDPPSDV